MTQRQSLHPALTWSLVISVLASAWALWWPQHKHAAPGSGDAGGSNRGLAPAPGAVPLNEQAPSTAARQWRSSEGSTLLMLTFAESDPFQSVTAPAARDAVQGPVLQLPSAAPPEPPVPAAAPPLTNHRVVGQFRSPEGAWLVFLEDGERIVLATPGSTLASGWVVESVTASELRLRHPQGELSGRLPLPADTPV